MKKILFLSLFVSMLSSKDFSSDECLLTYEQQVHLFKSYMQHIGGKKKDYSLARKDAESYKRETELLVKYNCMGKLFESKKDQEHQIKSYKSRYNIMIDTLYFFDPK